MADHEGKSSRFTLIIYSSKKWDNRFNTSGSIDQRKWGFHVGPVVRNCQTSLELKQHMNLHNKKNVLLSANTKQ